MHVFKRVVNSGIKMVFLQQKRHAYLTQPKSNSVTDYMHIQTIARRRSAVEYVGFHTHRVALGRATDVAPRSAIRIAF